MRVLLAAHQRLAPGGIGTVARGYAAHLPAAMEGYGSVTISGDDQVPRLTGPMGGIGPSGAIARGWFEQVTLARRSRDFDLVHLCDLRPLALSGTRFVITVHDVDFLDSPKRYPLLARTYKAAMLKAALRKRPARIVCQSEFVRDRLQRHLPARIKGGVRVIRPGVDGNAPAWTGAGDPPFFVTISTITPRKNHLGLLQAFRAARRGGLRLRWLVAGAPGPSSAGIVRALESEPGVEVLGEVDPATLNRLYSDALFAATPSAAEGFGYSPLEAMARGTPTLNSSGGSLAEIVGDGGPLLAAADTAAWADALLWLAEDADARRRLSDAGRRRAAEFSWPAAAASMVQLYHEACD